MISAALDSSLPAVINSSAAIHPFIVHSGIKSSLGFEDTIVAYRNPSSESIVCLRILRKSEIEI